MSRLKRDEKGLRVKIGVCKECKVPRKRLNHYGVCEDCRREVLQGMQAAFRNAVQDLDADIHIVDRIRHLLSQGFSYRFQAEQMGKDVTPADLSRLVAGVEPKSARKRQALGLPVQQLVTACAECGQVHVSKRCTEKRQSRKPAPRISMSVSEDLRQAVKNAAEKRGLSVAKWLRYAALEQIGLDAIGERSKRIWPPGPPPPVDE